MTAHTLCTSFIMFSNCFCKVSEGTSKLTVVYTNFAYCSTYSFFHLVFLIFFSEFYDTEYPKSKTTLTSGPCSQRLTQATCPRSQRRHQVLVVKDNADIKILSLFVQLGSSQNCRSTARKKHCHDKPVIPTEKTIQDSVNKLTTRYRYPRNGYRYLI